MESKERAKQKAVQEAKREDDMDLEDVYAERMNEQARLRTRQAAREDQTRQELTYFLASATAIDTHVQKFIAAAANAGFPDLDGLSKKEKRNRRVESRQAKIRRYFYDSGFRYPGLEDRYKMMLRIHVEGAWQCAWQFRPDEDLPSLSSGGGPLDLGRDGRGIYAGWGPDRSWHTREIDPIGTDAEADLIKVYADPNVTYRNALEGHSKNSDIEPEVARFLADLMLALEIPIR